MNAAGGVSVRGPCRVLLPPTRRAGELPVSRSAASILQLLGLGQWVAPSIDGYVECAARAAREVAVIQALRKSLRQRMRHSPLMNEAGFTRDFEAAVRWAWRRFCAA